MVLLGGGSPGGGAAEPVSGVPVLQFLVDRLREHSAHLQGGLAQPAAGHGEGREELRTLRSICRHFVPGDRWPPECLSP